MTPLDRLLAESIPTRPAPAIPRPRRFETGHRWTQAEQDAHWAALAEALGIPCEPRPHLHAINPAA